jgi:hypothetical protein
VAVDGIVTGDEMFPAPFAVADATGVPLTESGTTWPAEKPLPVTVTV